MTRPEYENLRVELPHLKLPRWEKLSQDVDYLSSLTREQIISVRAAKMMTANYVSPDGFLIEVNANGERVIDFTPFFDPNP